MSLNCEVSPEVMSTSPLSTDLGRVFPSREKTEAKNCDSKIAGQPPAEYLIQETEWIISSLFIKF